MYLGMCVGHYKSEGLSKIQKIEKLAKMGFKYLSGCGVEYDATKDEINELKQVLADNGCVPVQCGGGMPSMDQSLEDFAEAFKPFAENNAAVGNKLTCPLPPKWDDKNSIEVTWGKTLDYFRKYAEICKDNGLSITCEIEPERDFITCKFSDAVCWIEDLDCDNFFMNVDTGHFTMWHYPPKRLRKYTEMVVHTHITDNDGRHQSWALGTGKTDNVGYINALLEGGFDENAKKHGIPPVACIELYIPGHDRPDFDEELKISIDWVAKNLPHVKLK